MTCFDPAHDHDRACYWDHLRCGWVCVPARPAPEAEPQPAAEHRQLETSGAAAR